MMSVSMTLSGKPVPWYKQRWPWILMAGPAVVVVAGVVTLWLAISSNDGLVSDDYYKEGLAVNQQLKRDLGASQLGLQADVMRSGQKLRLLIQLGAGSRDGLPEVITLKFTHPTRAGHDQNIKMSSQGGGLYSGEFPVDLSGRWIVSLEDPAGQWRLQGEWLTDSGEPLRLAAKADN